MDNTGFSIVPFPDDFDIDSAFAAEPGAPKPPSDPEKPRRDSDGDSSPRVIPIPQAAAKAERAPETPAISVADLIENNVRLEWPEAVAIALQLCRMMQREPAAQQRSAIEPWNVELTGGGEVRVVPAGPSGDPVVRQLGRVLQALLQDTSAPVALRLIASQASFEIPLFSSLEGLSLALREFHRPGESDAIRAAFQRGLEAKFSMPAPPAAAIGGAATPLQSIQSWSPVPPRVVVPATASRRAAYAKAASMAAGGLVMAVIIGGYWTFKAYRVDARPAEAAPAAASTAAPPVVFRAANPPPVVRVPQPAANVAAPAAVIPPPAPTRSVPSPRAAAPRALPPAPAAMPPAAASVARPVEVVDASMPPERRAKALIAAGRAEDAAILFESILIKNPSYRLESFRSDPELLAVLRRSKRSLLPTLARRRMEEATAAIEAGDPYRAVAEAERAAALIADPDLDEVPADLRTGVGNVLALARTARTTQEETIYTLADRDVTAPRPIGRQLPAPVSSASSEMTGRLEILVNRSGLVDTVKLYTPGNGYHDRMIVSAAKAWHYKPALKNGRPVRFMMVVYINLPEP